MLLLDTTVCTKRARGEWHNSQWWESFFFLPCFGSHFNPIPELRLGLQTATVEGWGYKLATYGTVRETVQPNFSSARRAPLVPNGRCVPKKIGGRLERHKTRCGMRACGWLMFVLLACFIIVDGTAPQRSSFSSSLQVLLAGYTRGGPEESK